MMPRPRKAPEPSPTANTVIASAARLNPAAGRGIPKKASQGWQDEAWGFLDTVGELAFGAQWVANALSRVVLQVVQDVNGETKTVTTGLPVEALAELFGGESGQEQMMSALGFGLFVPGESYLVGVESPPPGIDQWRVLSSNEVKLQGTRWEIDRGDGVIERYLAKADEDDPTSQPEALVFRIWRPHPRMGVEATSPVRAALPILRELEGLTMHIGASIDSRLAGAGLLLVPSEMTFASPTNDQAPNDPNGDDFLMALVEAMEAAKADRDSPAALAPIVLRVPGALIEKVQHITFTTPLAQEARELREEAIRRLALSLDMPPEVLTGQSDSNHWSAWLISEDSIKVHIEPLVGLICHALTTQYLWPVLAGDAQGGSVEDPEVRSYRIAGDTSALRLRPSRTSEAMTLHERMIITDAALARETGFDGGDLLEPGSEEMSRRLLRAVAGGVTTADLTAAALAALGVDLEPKAAEAVVPGVSEEVVVGEPAVAPGSPTPAIEAPREIPSTVAAAIMEDPIRRHQLAALLATADIACHRALEKANSRLGNRGKHRKPITDQEALARATHDAWELMPRVAACHQVDPEKLTAACSMYVRGRMITASDHDPERLLAYLVPLVTEDDPGA